MANTYAKCLAFTLMAEGGWVDNPRDPGGPTRSGITLASYQLWKNDHTLTADDLSNISPKEISDFYYQQFWLPIRAEQMPAGVDLMVWDAAVNMGICNSVILLQDCLGIPMDGVVGPITLATANALKPIVLIDLLAQKQLAYYRALDRFPIFGRGWSNRVIARQKAAIAMINA